MAATIWRGRIAFGLVSIPVRLHKAARRERIQFHNVYSIADGQAAEPAAAAWASNLRQFPGNEEPPLPQRVGRVHQAFVGEDPNVPLSKDELLKACEIEPDRYVVLRPSEVDALKARASTNLEIDKFVALSEIDRNYFDASYYVEPDHGAEKAYALLYRALVETGRVAIGELVMYGREYAVCIRPGGHGLVLHTLFYGDEVRVADEAPADLGLVDEKALEMAKMLVDAHSGTFNPKELKDKFRQRVLDVVASRTETAVPGATAGQQREAAPVVDIMDALRRSLDAARKPPQSEGNGGGSPKKDKRKAK